MTNMQHYMDDIHDLLDGLDGEMAKRLEKIGKWDSKMAKYSEEIRSLEEFVFDMSNSKEERTEKLCRLAELRGRLRELADRKVELADRNQMTVQAVYSRLTELAYHCKCEVEIDNPGCTEQRERQFCQSVEFGQSYRPEIPHVATEPIIGRTREISLMTDDDRNSTRSGTPIGKEITTTIKKRVGRPRNVLKGKNHNSSAFSSTRSSVEHDGGRNDKKMSKYMRKKQERMRMEEEERARMPFEIKKEVDVDFEGFGMEQWGGGSGKGDLEEEDEQELLNCLLPGFEGLPSPPKGMMEALDVTETGLYGMEMYPPDHDRKSEFTGMSSSNNASYSIKKTNNAATSSSSGELAEKRKRNMLFGSIAETSFSGRPRKLTDRVTKMIESNREKVIRQKMKRDSEEWCFCGGANTNSDMMVECENKDCRIEWFHFECVGLTESPPNEWYCPECRLL